MMTHYCFTSSAASFSQTSATIVSYWLALQDADQKVMWDLSAQTGSNVKLEVKWELYEGWDHKTEFYPFHI